VQVLVWVYQLKCYKEDGGIVSDELSDLDVLKEFDKGGVIDVEAE